MLWVFLCAGLLLLMAGGDLLVRGAVRVAQRLGVSPLLIGLTLVGFGTSSPELVTSVNAALAGSPGIAVGNVVGSNIANILLILGVAALLLPVPVDRRAFHRDGGALLLATLLAFGMFHWGELQRLPGLGMVLLLAGYILYTYLRERQQPLLVEAEELAAQSPRGPGWIPVLMAIGGLALVIVGAEIFVEAAVALAKRFGISETVIGLTVVAIGTSLPELVTSVVAAIRGRAEVALGNVIGSNLYNTLGILGVTALVKPIAVPPEIVLIDAWVMLGTTLLLLLLAVTGSRVSRVEGFVLFTLYCLYIIHLGELSPL